jgi:hypothetical protein
MLYYALRPKKRSPSRLRLGDCAADPRSVRQQRQQSVDLQLLSMIRLLFCWCYTFTFTVKFSENALSSAQAALLGARW